MATGIQLKPPERRNDAVAKALAGQAIDASPKGHPLAALAQALQGFMAGKIMRQNRTAEEEQQQRTIDALRGQFAGPLGGSQSPDIAAQASGQPQQATPVSLGDDFTNLQPAGQGQVPPEMMGALPGQQAIRGPAPPPDSRPQMPDLARALLQGGQQDAGLQVMANALAQQQQPIKPTDDIREFEFARQQGFEGNFQQWLDRNQREPNERTLARDRKIRDYMENFPNATRADAIKWADNLLHVTVDDLGNRVLVDETVPPGQPGSARILESDVPEQMVDEQDEELFRASLGLEGNQTLWDMAQFATGPASAIRAGIAPVQAWAGLEPHDQTLMARHTFELAGREIATSMVRNPRFPVAEVEARIEGIGLNPRIWDSPPLLETRMKGLDRFMRVLMRNAEQDAEDKTLPKEVQNAQRQNARLLRNFLPVLGVPQGPRREESGQVDDIDDLIDIYAPPGGS